MKAVVMAGGEGTRLRPLTCDVPKPMVPVIDKPVMEYAIELLKKHSINEIAVTLQYLPENIKAYFGDGSDWGVNLHYYVEETPLGTAGSVKNAQEFLDEPFIVISGDALTDFNLGRAIDFHREKQGLATIVLTRVHSPLEYGLVLTEESGAISRFLEKPSWGEVFSDTVNTGIYILEPAVLDYIPAGTCYDFSRDVFPRLLKEKKGLFGCILDGYWCDIGSCEQYHQVHLDILDGKVNINIAAERQGNLLVGQGVRISPDAVLRGPAYVGSNCEVQAGARLEPYTVLGEGSVVKKGASLKRTITWKGCCIGPGAQLRGTILGTGVTVQSKARIFEGAVIGDGSTIETGATVKPGVKVWPHKYVEEGRVVSDSLVWGARATRGLFKRGGIKDELNTELTPEKCARIGRALGSFVPWPAQVALGTDFFPASRMVSDSLAAGLASTGVQVLDTGRVILPAFRYAAANLGVHYGVYTRVIDPGSGSVNILIITNQGADLPKRDERKIENFFYREEFRQVPVGQICDTVTVPDINSMYLTTILNSVNVDAIKRKRFGLVMAGEENRLSDYLMVLLDQLGCHVTRVDSWHRRNNRFEDGIDAQAAIEAVSKLTQTRGLNLGVYLYDSGQKLALVDRFGRVIKDEEYFALLSRMFIGQFQTVFMPVYMPVAAETTARANGKTVVRTKTGPNDLMEEMLNGGEKEQFRLYFDGLYAAVKVLEFLADRALELSEVLDGMPRARYHKREIPVPWEHKGRVIRRLAEEGGPKARKESVEGVRLEDSWGWSLVLPDEERPVCRIYSEGFSQEVAESLTEFYEEKIRHICSENGNIDGHQ